MAHRKAGGSAKSLRDSNPQYLGVKRGDGQRVSAGEVIVRQRGIKILPGRNVITGKDHTLQAKIDGTVRFETMRKKSFTGKTSTRSVLNIEA